ncbi:MAG TPA: hypothetical protein ENI97_02205 [Gammaproteobacteria bacterium]|nr:hypothetical protein [Gammaproteobacteria bacterium]
MNCTEFNNHLTDGVDQTLDADTRAAFDAHRASCAACQAEYAAELDLVRRLRALPGVTPPEGFADRVLAGAIKHNVAQQRHHHRRGFVLGFGSAAAAALAMWVVVGMSPDGVPGSSHAPQQQVAGAEQAGQAEAKADNTVTRQPVVSIALNTQQQIRLAFASSEPLQGARITIRLPENVALVGYPGRRQLSWETNLKKGDNLLNLPVIATQVASGELIANIEYAGQVKTLKLNIETAAESSLRDRAIAPFVG